MKVTICDGSDFDGLMGEVTYFNGEIYQVEVLDNGEDFTAWFPPEALLFSEGEQEPPEDNFRDDVEADADALASAGFGCDEDYNSSMDHFEDCW